VGELKTGGYPHLFCAVEGTLFFRNGIIQKSRVVSLIFPG